VAGQALGDAFRAGAELDAAETPADLEDKLTGLLERARADFPGIDIENEISQHATISLM
jgi:hypothetical protein